MGLHQSSWYVCALEKIGTLITMNGIGLVAPQVIMVFFNLSTLIISLMQVTWFFNKEMRKRKCTDFECCCFELYCDFFFKFTLIFSWILMCWLFEDGIWANKSVSLLTQVSIISLFRLWRYDWYGCNKIWKLHYNETILEGSWSCLGNSVWKRFDIQHCTTDNKLV